MARQLGEKSRLVRAAISANPGEGDKAIAEMLTAAHEGVKFSARDVGEQRAAMNKPGAQKVEVTPEPEPVEPEAVEAPEPEPEPDRARNGTHEKPAGKKRGRKPGQKTAKKSAAPAASAPAPTRETAATLTVEMIESVCGIARRVGGFDELKKLVDVLTGTPAE